MTAQNPVSVEQYAFQADDCLFLDANIWLFVYGPQQPKDKTDIYSDALSRILKARSSIYIDILVVSEIVNAYARMRWRLNASHIPFKKFRNSSQFVPIAEEIADYVRRIVSLCSQIKGHYGTVDVEAWMNEYETGGYDFNDQVIRDLCKSKGWMLITDDADFDAKGYP